MLINICYYELLLYLHGEDPDKIASAETDSKMETEINNRKLTEREIDILNRTIEKYKVTEEKTNEILKKYGYKSLEEIKITDYAKIGNELSK